MEGGAVVFGGFLEMCELRERDTIGGRSVEGLIACFVDQPDAARLDVSGDDGFGGLVSVGGSRQLLRVLCGQAFALIDVEDVEVAQEGKFLLFAGLFIFLFDPLPEDDSAAFFALFDFAAFGLTLLEGDVFTGTTEQHLIEKAVRLAGCVADGVSGADPRLFPRNDSVFELFHDAVGNFLIKIHFFRAPSSCGGALQCGRMDALPGLFGDFCGAFAGVMW